MLLASASPQAHLFRSGSAGGGLATSRTFKTGNRQKLRKSYCDLECVCISTRSGLEDLKEDWQRLYDTSASAPQFFQSYAWMQAWADVYLNDLTDGPNGQLAIVAGYQRGQLVMVWPLVKVRRFGIDVVSWMGAPVTQYGDVLVTKSDDTHYWLSAGIDFIQTILRPDAILLGNVRADATVQTQCVGSGFQTLRTEHAPFIDLSPFPSIEAFRAAYSKRTRKTRLRKRRRFFEQDHAKSEINSTGLRAQKLTRIAVALKRRWLAARNVSSRALSTKGFDAFFGRVVQESNTSFRPLVTALSRGHKQVAVETGFIAKQTYFSHMAAYDVTARSLSAGMLQFEDTIEYCIANGIQKIDLLAPSDSYKLDWTNETAPVRDYAKAYSIKGAVFVTCNGSTTRRLLKAFLKVLPNHIQSKFMQTIS